MHAFIPWLNVLVESERDYKIIQFISKNYETFLSLFTMTNNKWMAHRVILSKNFYLRCISVISATVRWALATFPTITVLNGLLSNQLENDIDCWAGNVLNQIKLGMVHLDQLQASYLACNERGADGGADRQRTASLLMTRWTEHHYKSWLSYIYKKKDLHL